MSCTAQVRNGKLYPDDLTYFKANIQDFEGKAVRVEISKAGKTRTNPQNSYYFGVVVKLIRDRLIELGYTKGDLSGGFAQNLTLEDVHEFLKANFNRMSVLVNKETGLHLGTYEGSTKDLPTEEFSDYIERISIWASTYLDLEIPEPDIKVGYINVSV